MRRCSGCSSSSRSRPGTTTRSTGLTLAATYPQVGGHVFFAAREVAVDPVGAMARVVADHYQQPAKPPR
ncbi:hypothetical protein [Streptomyces sp. NPDC088350]|uniref:hypothetical protein n=1 Tax=Streptomyces sp. NPDC088350 TaxID=3365854 RepID=UPI00382E73A8